MQILGRQPNASCLIGRKLGYICNVILHLWSSVERSTSPSGPPCSMAFCTLLCHAAFPSALVNIVLQPDLTHSVMVAFSTQHTSSAGARLSNSCAILTITYRASAKASSPAHSVSTYDWLPITIITHAPSKVADHPQRVRTPIRGPTSPTAPVGIHLHRNHRYLAADGAHIYSEPLLWHLVIGRHRRHLSHPLSATPYRLS